MVYGELLSRFVIMSRETLGDNVIGIYLHGSAAMGCFHKEKSDLDLLLVVEKEPLDKEKHAFMNGVVALNEEASAKGLELSVVKKEVCKPFVYPTPFELHFSVAHLNWWKESPDDYVAKMKGTDKDLAAHFTIINQYGIALYGAPVAEIFGPVPKEDYIDSILFDVEGAQEDILESPMYMTLNLCRVLGFLQEDLVLSKKSGGEWGLANMPERFRGLISEALLCYETEKEMKAKTQEERNALAEFAGEMLRRSRTWKES